MGKRLNAAAVFEKVGYEPHNVQKEIHKAMLSHRFCVVCAGRRTGKSTTGGHCLVCHAYEAYFRQDELDRYTNRMEYWIVGPEYTDAEKEFRVLWSDLERLEMPFDKPGSYYDVNGKNMHISLWDGKFQVHAMSAKYPNSLVGEKLRGVIMAEAAKMKPSIWYKHIRPMLADYRGWALFNSTPEGKNWFYDVYMQGVTAEPGDEWWSIRMPSWANSILFPEGRFDPEILSMEADLTTETFNQEIGAEFNEFAGRVFKDFDEESHVRNLTFNPELQTFGATDYGWTNPFVWLLIQVDVFDNVYVLGEVYGSHKRIDEVHHEIKDNGLCPPQLKYFYPDPAEPGDTRILESNLRISSRGGTGGEIKDRLRLIRNKLKIPNHLLHLPFDHKDRKPKLFIDPSCKNLIREMGEYRYPETKEEANRNDSENPMKKDDHGPEALGRFFRGYFGPEERSGRLVVAASTMG